MSTVAHFFIIIVAQKFVITWLTFSLTFTREQNDYELCFPSLIPASLITNTWSNTPRT